MSKLASTTSLPIPCKTWAEKLASGHPDDLSPSEHTHMREHLASCRNCAATYAQYRAMDKQILHLPAVTRLAELPPALQELVETYPNTQVHTLTQHEKQHLTPLPRPAQKHRKRTSVRRQQRIRVASSLAAVLAIGVLISGFLVLFTSHRFNATGGGAPTTPGATIYDVTEDNGTVYAIQPGNGAVYWQSTLGHKLTGAVAIAHGKVYASAYNGSVYALSAKDGKQLWEHSIGSSPLPFVDPSNFPYPVIQTDAQNIYFAAPDGIYALRGSDGGEIWHTPPVTACNTSIGADANTCMRDVAMVKDNIVYVYFNGLYALNASNGKVLWHDNRFQSGLSSIAVIGSNVYVHTDNTVFILQTKDGKQVKTLNIDNNAPIYGMIAVDGVLYLRTGNKNGAGEVYAVKADDNTVLWRVSATPDLGGLVAAGDGNLYFTDRGVIALRMSDGSLHWRSQAPAGVSSHPLATAGVFCFETSNGLYAIQASDGKDLWHVLSGHLDVTDPTTSF